MLFWFEIKFNSVTRASRYSCVVVVSYVDQLALESCLEWGPAEALQLVALIWEFERCIKEGNTNLEWCVSMAFHSAWPLPSACYSRPNQSTCVHLAAAVFAEDLSRHVSQGCHTLTLNRRASSHTQSSQRLPELILLLNERAFHCVFFFFCRHTLKRTGCCVIETSNTCRKTPAHGYSRSLYWLKSKRLCVYLYMCKSETIFSAHTITYIKSVIPWDTHTLSSCRQNIKCPALATLTPHL